MLAFPPTQIGYPQHRRFHFFLQVLRQALQVKNSPTLEVIASPVAIFILLRKRKHFKRCAAQTVYQQLAKPKKGAI